MKTAILGMVYILVSMVLLLLFMFHEDLRCQILALGGLLFIKDPLFKILDSKEWRNNKIIKKLDMIPEE